MNTHADRKKLSDADEVTDEVDVTVYLSVYHKHEASTTEKKTTNKICRKEKKIQIISTIYLTPDIHVIFGDFAYSNCRK